jgi:hypothetical protein
VSGDRSSISVSPDRSKASMALRCSLKAVITAAREPLPEGVIASAEQANIHNVLPVITEMRQMSRQMPRQSGRQLGIDDKSQCAAAISTGCCARAA